MDVLDPSIAHVAEDMDVGPDEFQKLLTSVGGHFDACCNQVALRLARRFDRGDLSFSDGDAVMNVVWGRIILDNPGEHEDGSLPIPEPTFAIYEAFDRGEHHHPDDDPDQDPVTLYTVPAIAEILLQHGRRDP